MSRTITPNGIIKERPTLCDFPGQSVTRSSTREAKCRDRLGGLLRYYHAEAARLTDQYFDRSASRGQPESDRGRGSPLFLFTDEGTLDLLGNPLEL